MELNLKHYIYGGDSRWWRNMPTITEKYFFRKTLHICNDVTEDYSSYSLFNYLIKI